MFTLERVECKSLTVHSNTADTPGNKELIAYQYTGSTITQTIIILN